MNVLLGGLLVGSFCWLGIAGDVPIQPDFDARKISGNWYPLAVVIEGDQRDFKFYPFKFEAKEDGTLILSFNVRRRDGRCDTKMVPLTVNTQPGDYKSKVPSSLHFVETDYDTFFIVHVERETASYMTLGGRKPNLTDDLKRRFTDLAVSLGFQEDVSPTVIKASC